MSTPGFPRSDFASPHRAHSAQRISKRSASIGITNIEVAVMTRLYINEDGEGHAPLGNLGRMRPNRGAT
jgi:hypothetical protein